MFALGSARLLLILAAALAVVPMGSAQSCPTPGGLSVTGTGSVSGITPDIGVVSLQVSVTKPSAKAAREEAAATTEKVVAALDAVPGIKAKDDVKTENINVSPQYVWNSNTQLNTITGYTFSQTLTVNVDNLNNDMLGAVVDASVKAGGNSLQVNYIQTDLSPPVKRRALNAARKAAVQDALSTAKLLAEAAGVKLGPLRSLVDTAGAPPMPQPLPMADAAAGAAKESATPTPINVGTTEVQASVSATFALPGSGR